MTEGLFFVAFCFYNPSASHSLGTSLYTREAVAKSIITQIGRENNVSAEILLLRTVEDACPYKCCVKLPYEKERKASAFFSEIRLRRVKYGFANLHFCIDLIFGGFSCF